MGRDSVTSLAPGFRFHPTDEELVRYYLRRKVCNRPFRFDAISEVDIYRSEPWDLPDKSKLKSRDLEWYFFSVLDKKYGNGSKTNRATEKGYWKTTGKDREIRCGSRTTGMKKTLVYHKGRAPRGERTNWVMHEYRLLDEELQKAGIAQDAFVLCRVFQKSGSGPKNGEQYGAPFVEEEWEDDVMALVPDQDVLTEEVAGGDDIYFDIDEFEQKPEKLLVHEDVPAPSSFYYGESSKNAESSNNMESGNLVESSGHFNQSGDFSEEDQKPFIGSARMQWGPVLPEDQVESGLPEENNLNLQSSDNEFTAGTSYVVNSDDTNYLLHEPYEDDKSNLPFDDCLPLQAGDFGNACDVEDFNFEEYLTFFETDDENAQNLNFDISQLENENAVISQLEDENAVPQEGCPAQKPVATETIPQEKDKNEASSSKHDPEVTKFESDAKYPILKKSSHMLGAIPSPSVFASECATKDAAIRLHSQSSGSVRVTAGMIRISSNISLAGGVMDWSYGKNGNINVVLSFGLVQEDAGSAVKTGSMLSWGFCLMLFWVLILSISFKIGICVRSR